MYCPSRYRDIIKAKMHQPLYYLKIPTNFNPEKKIYKHKHKKFNPVKEMTKRQSLWSLISFSRHPHQWNLQMKKEYNVYRSLNCQSLTRENENNQSSWRRQKKQRVCVTMSVSLTLWLSFAVNPKSVPQTTTNALLNEKLELDLQ